MKKYGWVLVPIVVALCSNHLAAAGKDQEVRQFLYTPAIALPETGGYSCNATNHSSGEVQVSVKYVSGGKTYYALNRGTLKAGARTNVGYSRRFIAGKNELTERFIGCEFAVIGRKKDVQQVKAGMAWSNEIISTKAYPPHKYVPDKKVHGFVKAN